MKLACARPLERLAHASERPEAAIFFSYTFDPAFFEEHVLRAVLQLTSDPQEQPARYHDEARRALQEIPVACVVDADVRAPGHRLPYDLLEVTSCVFHPKLVVLVFATFARVSVGSGNLTRGGYGESAETFLVRDFAFDTAEDAAVLREIAQFVRGVFPLLRVEGTQLELALRTFEGHIRNTREPKTRSLTFVHSLTVPILDQVRALLPVGAELTRAGILAPFFERDDVVSHARDEWSSVIGSLVAGWKRPAIDIGVLWEDSPLAGSGCQHPASLGDGIGKLWAWTTKDESGAGVHYRRLLGLTATKVEMADERGTVRRTPRDEAERALVDGDVGVIGAINAHAPAGILAEVAATTDLTLWLHPSWRHHDGRPLHRSLHAKILLLTTESRKQTTTLVVLGSPNPSRGALLRSVTEGGNVECAFAFLVDGALRLPDVCPELVTCPRELVELHEREYPLGEPDLGQWIETATHDAEKETLTVRWATSGPEPLGAWTLRYADEVLARGDGAPTEPTVRSSFTLLASSCEVELEVQTPDGPRQWAVPILVADLAQLPVNTELAGLSLRELLALLGQRVGTERLGALRAQRGREGMGTLLEAIFGEGFGPTDVFRAYWSVAETLGKDGLSAPAFHFHLSGSLSVRALWLRMKEGADTGALTREEVWFYGAELVRTLAQVHVPSGAGKEEKEAMLEAFAAEIRASLVALTPSREGASWLDAVSRHYDLAPTTNDREAHG